MRDTIDELELYADLLRADGRDGKARAVERAARSIEKTGFVTPDPAQLKYVGDTLREVIADLEIDGECDEIEALKAEYPHIIELTKINGIGPAYAQRIHDEYGITGISGLVIADLTAVRGITKEMERDFEEQAKALLDS